MEGVPPMKLEIETWLEENSIPQSAKNLFSEAIICYKVSAYRSSFIMSYIGFQNILKEKILNSTKIPDGIDCSYWKQIINKICDDNTWDEQIYTCVNMQNPNRIFMVNKDITKQYEYWRTIRNSCAHGKDNIISYSHTEAFWLFIQSYYRNFTINCGPQGLLEVVSKHYDIRYTEKNKDCSYIINSISSELINEELKEFIIEVFKFFYDKWHTRRIEDSEFYEFIHKMLIHKDNRLRENVLNFIKSENGRDYLYEFVQAFPSTINELMNDKSFARLIWTEKIFEANAWNEGPWKIIKHLLVRSLKEDGSNNSIIPKDEFEDFIKNLYKWSNGRAHDDIIELLKATNFYTIMKKDLFMYDYLWDYPNGINHANFYADRIAYYIKTVGLDEDIVRRINLIYSFATYGEFYNRINCLMQKYPEIMDKYIEIVKELNITDYSPEFKK